MRGPSRLHMPDSDLCDREHPQGEDELRLLIDAVPVFISYIDTELRYRQANETYRRIYGRTVEDIRGLHVSELIGPGWEVFRPYMERALAGETVVFEREATVGGRSRRRFHVTYTPHQARDGRVCGFIALVQDVTEQRRVEQALREKEWMLVQSQRMAQVGSWELDLARLDDLSVNPLRWSDEIFSIFGYAPGSVEVTNALFFSAVSDRDRGMIEAAVDRSLKSGEPYEVRHEIRRPDGSVRWVHQWAEVERDAEGRPVRMLGTCQDVTNQRQLEQALRDALEQLRVEGRRKDEFLAMLAHELRNPLAPVLSAVEVLGVGRPSDEVLASQREVVARQVRHMKRLLDDLLDVARVSQGKIVLRRQAVDLVDVLLQAVEVARPAVAARHHELSIQLPQRPLHVAGDPTRLTQVFANLLHNAAKYTDTGGQVTLEAVEADGQALVRVRDTGVGMAPELLERVFDLFTQDDRSLDRAQGGLGIGLTLARSLVEMHGGRIGAASDGPGRGSVFTVTLPLRAEPRLDPPPAGRDPARAHRRTRVLIVDDNVDGAESLALLLRMSGHEVTVANDGPAAIAAAHATRPRIVLLDIGLPGMDGYQVAAELRRAGLDTTLIALTGYGRDEDVRRSREVGFARHLVKPVDAATLESLLDRYA